MSVLPVTHFTWQVLRTVKRSRRPPSGRALRLIPSKKTKDGTFLTALVTQGLLTRVTGSADAPFEATYVLTEKGKHAAEYGECEDEPPPPAEPEPPAVTTPPVDKRKR